MSTRNSKTANAFDLSDALTKLQLEKDDLFDLFVEDESELKEGDYDGQILVIQRIPSSNRYKAMIRIEQLHGSQIPINDDAQFTANQKKMLIYNHVCAISETDLHPTSEDEEGKEFCENMIGRSVLVKFGQSPNQRGKTRFARFSMPETSVVPDRNASLGFGPDCVDGASLEALFAGLGGGFLLGGAGADGGPNGNPPKTSRLQRYTKGKVKQWPIA